MATLPPRVRLQFLSLLQAVRPVFSGDGTVAGRLDQASSAQPSLTVAGRFVAAARPPSDCFRMKPPRLDGVRRPLCRRPAGVRILTTLLGLLPTDIAASGEAITAKSIVTCNSRAGSVFAPIPPRDFYRSTPLSRGCCGYTAPSHSPLLGKRMLSFPHTVICSAGLRLTRAAAERYSGPVARPARKHGVRLSAVASPQLAG